MTKQSTAAFVNPEIQLGTVLVANHGYTMILPVFYRVVRRTAKTMCVTEIKSVDVPDDEHGFTGYSYADLSDDSWMIAPKSSCSSVRLNGSYIKINGHYAKVWDGNRCRFDHLD